MSFKVEFNSSSLSSSIVMNEYETAVADGIFLNNLHSLGSSVLNNIYYTRIDYSYILSNANDDSTVKEDYIAIVYIVAAIIPGLLIFIIGCLVECLRNYYKEFIGSPTESSIMTIANLIIKGK